MEQIFYRNRRIRQYNLVRCLKDFLKHAFIFFIALRIPFKSRDYSFYLHLLLMFLGA